MFDWVEDNDFLGIGVMIVEAGKKGHILTEDGKPIICKSIKEARELGKIFIERNELKEV